MILSETTQSTFKDTTEKLSDSVKSTFKDAAKKLTGYRKRMGSKLDSVDRKIF